MLAKCCQALETVQSTSVSNVQTTATVVVNPGQSSVPGIVAEGCRVGRGRGQGMKWEPAQSYVLRKEKLKQGDAITIWDN